ncbi:MAG: fluoroquinolone resistance protein [Saprospiraceae bacterium]|jgi:uncharacterized protein YjbI with pentapeptide repeats|tara:strand:+ start:3972 stop:4532 length:561 start_codon:yes stop_codon:yes gene_type:complete
MPFEEIFMNISLLDVESPAEEFESCTFTQCDFSEAKLSKLKFIDCEFLECNLSNATLDNTALQNVSFIGCKLLGVHFEHANPFGIQLSFSESLLDHSSFYQMKLPGVKFNSCRLHFVDFTEALLKNAAFEMCNLTGAIFYHTNLEKADFRTSESYSMNPEENTIKGSSFSQSGISGLLDKYGLNIE